MAGNVFVMEMNSNEFGQVRLANPRHRFAGYVLEFALILSTCFIGWFIWSLVVWNQGLTPAKQILKLRIINESTNKPATWGHMCIRQFLIPIAFSLPYYLADGINLATTRNLGYENSYGLNFSVIIFLLLSTGIQAVDAFWILRGQDRKRLTDIFCKTRVINESHE